MLFGFFLFFSWFLLVCLASYSYSSGSADSGPCLISSRSRWWGLGHRSCYGDYVIFIFQIHHPSVIRICASKLLTVWFPYATEFSVVYLVCQPTQTISKISYPCMRNCCRKLNRMSCPTRYVAMLRSWKSDPSAVLKLPHAWHLKVLTTTGVSPVSVHINL